MTERDINSFPPPDWLRSELESDCDTWVDCGMQQYIECSWCSTLCPNGLVFHFYNSTPWNRSHLGARNQHGDFWDFSESVRSVSFYDIQIQKLQETLRTAGYQQQLWFFFRLQLSLFNIHYDTMMMNVQRNTFQCSAIFLLPSQLILYFWIF